MELEIDAVSMVFQQRTAPGQSQGKLLEALVSRAATPMVSSERRQNRVAKRELRFADVASNEIGVLIFKRLDAEMFAREEQARAAVHQQARRLGQRQEMRGAMVFASAEQFITAEEPFVACDHVVKEHGDRRATQFIEGHDFELNFESDGWRQFVAQSFERVAVAKFKCVAVAPDENVKLKIVVRALPVLRLEHAAFAATIAAAEQQPFDAAGRKS